MKTTFTNISKICMLAFAAVIVFGLQSCYKRDYTTIDNNTTFDNTVTVTSSVYGIVQDEAGMPVKAAVVKTSGYTALTDDNGLFFFNNIITPSRATTVVVTKDGYFNGSRTLTVNANDKHTVKITMLAKGTSEVFFANNGGTVNFADGVSITFPANAIVNKQSGQPYNGQVYVFAKKIDPTTALGQTSMPGDLRGIATTGYEKLLRTFGMMVAELYDINGNALQIANTSSATLSLTVPASLLAMAPQNMVLWSFDETKGMWVEDGGAVLQGNKYVGAVKHFSFWNCDTPEAAIYLEMTVQDQNGNPLQNYAVKLTNTANLDTRQGNTSANGWVGGLCYSNAVLTLEVYDNNICGFAAPLYTSTITTGAANMNLGIITVNLGLVNSCSFDATVHDCLGAPITNASVYIAPLNLILTPNALGQITYSLPCVPAIPITLYAYDLNNNVYGSSNYTLVAGANNIGVINACGNVAPFLTVNLTNTVTMASATQTFTVPANSLSCYLQGPNTYLNASSGAANVYLAGDGNTVGTFNLSAGSVTGVGAFTDTLLTLTGVNTMTFTVFPAFPGDVQGTYNANFTGSPSGDAYTATGTFRIPRNN
ncbi:MAG: carboxypeptidase regulatory-like domain-containing protein [Chitinophagaceae bacterium]|nr:carboxypeptidase regulatory-like domain-containing protein [Chitinophagaceae bacterium]